MFLTLLKKELREQLRTSRLLVIAAILFISGLISPVLAKYTPTMLAAVPGLPAECVNAIAAPSLADSVGQYVKNITQFGVLLVILFNMGTIAQEKERGTAAMLLTKPVSRTVIVLAKWTGAVIVVVIGMAVAALAMAFYTTILFGQLKWGGFLVLNLLMILFLVVYVSAAIAASALAKNQGMAAAYGFGGLALLLVASSLPWISKYMPANLLNWGAALSLGAAVDTAWLAVLVSAVLVILFLLLASFKFEKEEI